MKAKRWEIKRKASNARRRINIRDKRGQVHNQGLVRSFLEWIRLVLASVSGMGPDVINYEIG